MIEYTIPDKGIPFGKDFYDVIVAVASKAKVKRIGMDFYVMHIKLVFDCEKNWINRAVRTMRKL